MGRVTSVVRRSVFGKVMALTVLLVALGIAGALATNGIRGYQRDTGGEQQRNGQWRLAVP